MNLKEMLEEFLMGKIEKKRFYQDIKKVFEECLNTNAFRRLELLKIYPFISELQDEDIYNENLIQEIREMVCILNGEKSFFFDLWMSLERLEISRYYRILNRYKKNKVISFDEHESIEKELQVISGNTKSIEDICMEKLLALLAGLPTIDDFYMYNTLYVDKFEDIRAEEEIEKLLDILSGNKPVHILIKYVKGECMFVL
ncbi:MAG: hypothetical protein HFI77_10095 [Lachnospiraceae bacterium]|nr:hypothetical protein [Lachnospiraceae bacterium]